MQNNYALKRTQMNMIIINNNINNYTESKNIFFFYNMRHFKMSEKKHLLININYKFIN